MRSARRANRSWTSGEVEGIDERGVGGRSGLGFAQAILRPVPVGAQLVAFLLEQLRRLLLDLAARGDRDPDHDPDREGDEDRGERGDVVAEIEHLRA